MVDGVVDVVVATADVEGSWRCGSWRRGSWRRGSWRRGSGVVVVDIVEADAVVADVVVVVIETFCCCHWDTVDVDKGAGMDLMVDVIETWLKSTKETGWSSWMIT